MQTLENNAGDAADVPGVTVNDSASRELSPSTAPALTGGFMSIIEKAAALENIDVDKLERMMAMQLQWEDRQAEVAFNEAMTRVAARIGNIKIVRTRGVSYDKGEIKKDAFKYAAIEDIDRLIAPILAEEGVTVSFDTEPSATQGWHNIIIRVSHGRHTKSAKVPLPLDTSGGKNNTQGMGSTYSYGKRYALCAFFNIVTVGDDDDGAGGAITDEQAAEIKTALRDTESDVVKFLAYMKVASVEEIRTRDYKKATALLESKKKQKEKANAHNP